MTRPSAKLSQAVTLAAMGAVAFAVACSSPTTNTPTPPATTTPTAALSSLTIAPSTVNAGDHTTGTVTLSTGAPTGGAVVSLLSSATDRATVPASLTIGAGATNSTFDITTPTSATAGTVTITGGYLGVTQTATLSVTVPAPVVHADFVVTPNTGTPANAGQCAVYQDTRNGGLLNELRCTFDGSASTPATSITEYRWTFPSGSNTVQFTGRTLASPTVACGTFSAAAQRDITLQITTNTGATSTTTKTVTFIKTAPC